MRVFTFVYEIVICGVSLCGTDAFTIWPILPTCNIKSWQHFFKQWDVFKPLNDNTKILTETNTETCFPILNFPKPIFFSRPNSPKPKPLFLLRDQIFRNQNRDFFPIPNSPKPKPSKHWQKFRNREVSKPKRQSLVQTELINFRQSLVWKSESRGLRWSVRNSMGCPKIKQLTKKIPNQNWVLWAQFSHRNDLRVFEPANPPKRNNFQTHGVRATGDWASVPCTFFLGRPVCHGSNNYTISDVICFSCIYPAWPTLKSVLVMISQVHT